MQSNTMTRITENTIEEFTMELLKSLSYQYISKNGKL